MNKLFKNVLFILLFFMQSTFAALPTVEGLFRNPNNKDLTGGVIVLKFMIEELENETPAIEEDKNTETNVETPTLGFVEEKMGKRFFKLIFSVEEDEVVKLLQVEYNDGKMKRQHLERMSFLPELEKNISEDDNIERSLFYSIVMMLTLNKSEAISEILGRYGTDYKRNIDVLNQDKMKLLEEYKNYLSITDDEKELMEDLESPLKPIDEDKKELVSGIMKENMYMPAKKVKLVREEGRFFWRVDLDTVVANFTNKEHRLKDLKVSLASGSIETNYGDYVIFDGAHELPKIMIFKDLMGRNFRLRMLDLDHLANKKGIKMIKRVEAYQKNIERVKKSLPEEERLNTQKQIFLY